MKTFSTFEITKPVLYWKYEPDTRLDYLKTVTKPRTRTVGLLIYEKIHTYSKRW